MSAEPNKVSSLEAGHKAKPMQTLIVGKVIRVRRYEQHTYTTIICPAADLYSKPSVVEIRSSRRFADKEEEVSVNAKLGGYEGKPYKGVDKESGERITLIPVNLYLDLVD